MGKKKRKKAARKQAKKKAKKLKKAKRKSALKKKKALKRISTKKPKLKKKKLKKKVKGKKAKKSPKKKKSHRASHGARRTLSIAHEIHHEEKIMGPEGQAFAGFHQGNAAEPARVSSLDAHVTPTPQPQENPEEKASPAEDRPGEDPDAERLDDLSH